MVMRPIEALDFLISELRLSHEHEAVVAVNVPYQFMGRCCL